MSKKKYEYKFTKLSPIILDEIKPVYISALEYAYKDDDIKNIAITGIYGAGKSSLWKTYEQEKYSSIVEDGVIHVSLADFKKSNNMDEEIGSDGKKIKKNNKRVEEQIINQIIYQIDSDKTIHSKYEIKKPISKQMKTYKAISFILGIVGIISLFNYDTLPQLLFNMKSSIGIFRKLEPLTLSIHLISIIFILNLMLSMFWNQIVYGRMNIKNFDVKIAKGEIDSDTNTDSIDQEMKELVYLITASKVKTIVFEDLDRFDDITLFVKLRELNFLVNSSLNDYTVRFIYMIRDELFDSKERVKFFDLIIPIVPYIDSKNSKSKIISLFKEIDDDLKPSDGTLVKLSMYIDDMRLLQNIRNEYEVYAHSIDLKGRRLNPDKMLGLIVLKNIFPEEYDRLQQDEGYIFKLFLTLNKLREEIEESRLDKIRELREEIFEYKSQIIVSKYELMALYRPVNFRVVTDEFDNMIELLTYWEKNPDTLYTCYINNKVKNYRYNEYLNLLKNDGYFKAKIEYYDLPLTEKIKLAEDKIVDLNKETSTMTIEELIKEIDDRTLDLLFTNFEINYDYDTDAIKNSEYDYLINSKKFPLIKYLIVNGLVDETYESYKSYFHEDYLTQSDEIFMRSLLAGENFEPSYRLNNIEGVVGLLEDIDYERGGIFNYDLFTALIDNGKGKNLNRMIVSIYRYMNQNIFLEYLNSLSIDKIHRLTNLLLQNDIKTLETIISSASAYSQLELDLLFSVYSSNLDVIENENIRKIIEEKNQVLELGYTEFENYFYEGLKRANVKINSLLDIELRKDIAIIIEEDKLYKHSIENIIQVCVSILDKSYNDVVEKLLNYIHDSELMKNSLEFVSNNMEDVIIEYTKTLKKIGLESKCSEEYFLQILNSEIDDSVKVDFIGNCSTDVEFIDGLRDSTLIKSLISRSQIGFNQINLNKLWEKNRDNKVSNLALVHYLNDYSNNKYAFELLDVNSDQANALINEEELNNFAFEKLIIYADLEIESVNGNLDDMKVIKLAEKKLIVVNEENIKNIINNNNFDVLRILANLYGDTVADIINNSSIIKDIITVEGIIKILNMKLFSNEKSITLIDLFISELSIKEIHDADDEIKSYIFINNTSKKDLDDIVENDVFIMWNNFVDLVNDGKLNNYLQSDISLSKSFLDKFFNDTSIIDGYKIELLDHLIIQKKFIYYYKNWISIIDSLKGLEQVFYRKKPEIINEEQNIISKALEEIGIISISEDGRIHFKPRVYEKMVMSQ